MAEKKQRLGYADMMKGIAVVGVVFYHLTAPCGFKDVLNHLIDIILAIFFVFSGYFYRLGKRSIGKSIVARLKAVMLPFLKYSLAFWLIGSVYMVIKEQETVNEALCCLRNFFAGSIWNRMIQDWFSWDYCKLGARYMFLADFWFLPAMMLASLLFFPIAELARKKDWTAGVAAVLLIGLTALLRHLAVNLPYNLQLVPFWAGLMLLGMLAGQRKVFEIPALDGWKGWCCGTAALPAVILCLCLCLAGIWVGGNDARAENLPAADVTYTNLNSPIVINENKTVKLSNCTYTSQENEDSPIKICGGVTVNLIIDGDVVLTGNTTEINYKKSSAGIEVEEGSTVNIYGLPGSTLTATGGKWGAGIGGIGYEKPDENNPKTGNINIFSGTIVAVGGDRGGAGIGSGFHSSASDIHIYGGNITAMGTGGGAGIGSGYGTSGGASTGAQIGFYNGGIITISGGRVRAAAWHMNFDQFDPYDIGSLYGEDYMDTFASGIGGGYGAFSGKIVIEGDADVIALGSCGGAGIGSGRGTSTTINYNYENTPVNITIRGNASVTAMATKDGRSSTVSDGGGAGIGTGYGIAREDGSTPVGSIRIQDNASVYAWAEAEANGIGTSWCITKQSSDNPKPPTGPDGGLNTLEIGENCTVIAISDGLRTPIDEDKLPLNGVAVVNNGKIIEDDPVPDGLRGDDPLKLYVGLVSTGEMSSVQVPFTGVTKRQIAVQLPGNTGALFFADDDQILMSDADDPWQFPTGKTQEIDDLIPVSYGITYQLNGGTNAEGNPASYRVYEKVVLKDPVWEHHAFQGWFDNEAMTGNPVKEIPAGRSDELKLWAKWAPEQFTVKFVNDDGTVLQEFTLEYGATPAYAGKTPEKAADADYTYVFSKWDPEIAKVTGDALYKAVFEKTPITKNTYAFTNSGAEWTKGSDKPLDLTVKGSPDDTKTYDDFMGLETDGKVTDRANYTAGRGSLKLSLKADYLESLTVGKHTLTVLFKDGKAETAFTVKAAAPAPKPVPKTGDEADLLLWGGLVILGIIGIVLVMGIYRKQRKKK